MRKTRTALLLGGAAALALGYGTIARAAVTIDGTVSPSEGYNLESTQTINTGFGDSTVGDGTSAGGSELDGAYATVQNNTLYLAFTGNFEDGTSPNHLQIFIADGRAGQNTLSIGGGPIQPSNGSVFSPGFQATFAIDANDYQGTEYVDSYDLTSNNANSTYQGGVALTGGVGNGLSGGAGTISVGLNNTNAAGVNGNGGTAANAAAADAVSTGFEVGIPLGLLGNPSGPINVMAEINGSGQNYLSNQFLPGLAVGTGNVGGGGPYTGANSGSFNFSNTPGEYFSVSVPEPASVGLLGGLATMLLARRRKA
jgi:hypothetical protein